MRIRPKIVVVDDSEIVLEVLRATLTAAGFQVFTHDRASGCVALILHEKPDLALIDVNMPGLSGDTVVSMLCKARPNNDTIVLLHSSLPHDLLREKVELAGAHGYIQKSGDMFSLVRDVNRWLKRSNSSGHMRVASRAVEQRLSSGMHAAVKVSDSTTDSQDKLPAVGHQSGTIRVDAPTVLLVDDDISVLSGYRRCMSSDELVVEFALSGGQALRRIASDNPPDVVVCDMLLPDVSGSEVYRRAVSLDPAFRQRFVVATGAAAVPAVATFLASFKGPVLHKPLKPEQLTHAIRACLSGGRRLSIKVGAAQG